MKREDIEKMADIETERYSEGAALYAQCERDIYRDGFVDGAEWRINSVWHDVNQEPSEKRVLIVIESDGRISQSNFMVGVDIWKDYVKDADIVKWCYKEDLLPIEED